MAGDDGWMSVNAAAVMWILKWISTFLLKIKLLMGREGEQTKAEAKTQGVLLLWDGLWLSVSFYYRFKHVMH